LQEVLSVIADVVKVLLDHLEREYEAFTPITMELPQESGIEPDYCFYIAIPSPNRKMPRFVGWVEARNPTNTLGFASLKRQVLQRR